MAPLQSLRGILLGHFATLRLQIPVQGGYSGGVLAFNDGIEQCALDHSRDSDTCFYLTVVHAGQREYEITEVTRGCRVELLINVVWIPPTRIFYPNLKNVPLFLSTLSKLHKDISNWCAEDDQQGPVKMLMILLDDIYEPETHSFSSLTDTDRLIAYLFRSLDMLEVHLSFLTRKTTLLAIEDGPNDNTVGLPRLEECLNLQQLTHFSTQHYATHWIDTNDRPIRFSNLNVDLQVQDIQALIDLNSTPDRVEVTAHDDVNATVELEYNRNVLVLWPRNKSFHVTLHHRFDHLLHLLEIEINEERRLVMLRSVLDYENEWQKNEESLCKLLNLCRILQAGEETLRLLEMLAPAGISSDAIAVLIAHIDSEVLGWPSWKPALERILKLNSLANLQYFVTLAINLNNLSSFSAFNFVADSSLDLFFQCDINLISREARVACVKLINVLADSYSHPMSATKQEKFLERFRSWSPAHQCNLITDLEDMWATSQSVLPLQTLSLFFVQNVNPLLPSDLLIDFLSMLLELHEDIDVREIFTSTLSLPSEYFPKGFLRELVPTFEEINPPREFLIPVLTARFAELQPEIAKREGTGKWVQEDAHFPAGDRHPEILSFLRSNEKVFVTDPVFSSVRMARKFAAKHFEPIKESLKLGYSAIATPNGCGKKCRLTIVKTLHVQADKLRTLKEELEQLTRKLTRLGVPTILPSPNPMCLPEVDEA